MLAFAKYQGAGNDFVLIDDRSCSFPKEPSFLISRLCHRRFGIGADGVILLQESDCADFTMRIWNADGSEPTMCGNGVRCLAHFIRHLGFAKEYLTIQTAHAILSVRWIDNQIAVNLGLPKVLYEHLQLPLKEGIQEVHVIHTGVPHAVVFVKDPRSVNLMELGQEIRHHPFFQPDGVNVNFASACSEKGILMRTYERGVEGETRSCGTGAAAAGWLAAHLFSLDSPLPIQTCLLQEDERSLAVSRPSLSVNVLETKEIELIGAASLVFEGSITL